MATIVNNTNHLEEELENKRKNIRNLWIVFVLMLVIFFPLDFVLVYFINKMYRECEILKSGLSGEKSALNVLSRLDSEYFIISDLEIQYDGKKSQIDSVIIGDNGVFVMETKNVNGHIVGNETEKDITVHKVGRKGGEYSNTMYNPCKQVGTHVYRLSKFLESNKVRPWVQGMVYFSNPETSLNFQSSKVPVFDYNKANNSEISNYISSYQGRRMSREDKKKIVELLSKCTMS